MKAEEKAEEEASREQRGELRWRLLVATVLLFFLAPDTSPRKPLPSELEAGASVQPDPGKGLPAEWWIPLQPGEAFHATVEQLGTDVVVELRRPDGEVLLTVDQPIGAFGPEPICFVDTEGPGVIPEVRPFGDDQVDGGRGGPYRLDLDYRGEARERDRRCWEAVRTFSHVVRRFQSEGKGTPELLAAAERARDAWQSAGFRFETAVAWSEMADIARTMEDLEAEVRYRRAALALLDPKATEDLGVASLRALLLSGLGSAEHALGEIREAEECFVKALELYRQLGADSAAATVLNNYARLLLDRGATHEAIEIYERVVVVARREDAPRLEAHAHLNLGRALSELGESARALDALSEAEELSKRLEDPELEALIAVEIGWVHTLAGREVTAIEWYEKALALAESEGLRAVEAAARDRLGTALRRLGRVEEARKSYRRALELSRSLGRSRNVPHVLANLGWVELEADRPREAVRDLTEACGLLEDLENPDALSYALAGLAEAHRRLGSLDQALEDIASAAALVERQRTLARGRGRRLLGVPLWPDYDAIFFEVLMDLDAERPNEGFDRRAFERADRARARHLYETLQDALVDLGSEAAPELLARERNLQEEIRAVEQTVGDDGETPGADGGRPGLKRRLRETLAELEDVRAEIRRTSPRLAELRDPETLSVDELQGLLDADTTLVSYHLGDARSFVFVVGRDQFEAIELHPRAEIEALARAVYQGLSHGSAWGSQLDLTTRSLAELVLEPVAVHLSGRRLLVAADGLLHYIPFAALPWPGAGGGPGEDDRVLDHYEVVAVPSASVLRALHRLGRGSWHPPSTVAVLADPVYPEGGSLPPLPFSRREAQAIRDLAGTSGEVRLFLGPEARPEVVRSGELDDAELIHFASHALIDEEEPELSRIALSEPESERVGVGSDLYLHEIYGLDLSAEMVVLSGCRTALGEAVRGEGLVGLTRGFFFAGTPRLVVSLWPVDDAATAALMEHFYQGLFAGLAPATALVQAQEQIRHTPGWEHPVFWAGFVLQGDWL